VGKNWVVKKKPAFFLQGNAKERKYLRRPRNNRNMMNSPPGQRPSKTEKWGSRQIKSMSKRFFRNLPLNSLPGGKTQRDEDGNGWFTCSRKALGKRGRNLYMGIIHTLHSRRRSYRGNPTGLPKKKQSPLLKKGK